MDHRQSCALCGSHRKLEQSHVIPQFAYRWAKERAGEGGVPAESVRALLCGACEDLFSAHESEFARLVFHPGASGAPLLAKYGGWLRKFAASVCWRILEERIAVDGLAQVNDRWAAELASCRATWKAYLNGKRPDVGAHHLHLLPVGAPLDAARGTASSAASTKVTTRDHMIEGAVARTDREAFVYAKLGPFILFGLIADPDPKQWQGTRINAEGKLKPREVVIPAAYRDYLL